MLRLFPLIALLLLPACATVAPKPKTITIERTVCVPNEEVSKEHQAQAAEELAGLPVESIVASRIVPDWVRMRNANRDCANKK